MCKSGVQGCKKFSFEKDRQTVHLLSSVFPAEKISMKHFRQCHGNILEHDGHDFWFGGRKVYLACLGLWISAFMALLPDIMGVKMKNEKYPYKL